MSKVTILLFVLLSRFAIGTDAVNPVTKFLKNRVSGGGGGGDQAELVATKASLAEHVKAAKVTGEQALRDTKAASDALTSLQKDMEELKRDNEIRIQQMSQSSDVGQQVAQVQEQAAARIEEVKARGERELAEAKEASEMRYDEMKAQYEHDYAAFTNTMATREAESKAHHERALAEASVAFSERVAELKVTIEKEVEMVASAVEKDSESTEANVVLAKKNEDLTTRLQELEALWKDSSLKIAAGKEEVRVQLQQEIDEMTVKHSEEIRALEGRLSALEHERNELIQLSADREFKVSQMQEESRQALNTALAEHEREVEGLNENIATGIMARKNMEKQTKKLEGSIATLKSERDQAVQDAQYWEGIFGERSYFNFTLIQEDTMAALQTAERATTLKLKDSEQFLQNMAHSASELAKTTFVHIVTFTDDSTASVKRHLSQASESAGLYKEKANVLYDQHLRDHVDASVQKANVLYDQHLKEHVEKARPHYEKHVVPPVEKSKAAAAQAVAATNTARTAVYASAVTKFQATCPKLLSLLADLKENKGLAVPDSVLENVKETCSKPEEVVSTSFTAALVLLAILFRGTLWRLFTGIVSLAFGIIWFFTPLRFFVKSSNGASKSDVNSYDSSDARGQ